MAHLREVLVEECLSEAVPSVCHESVNGPAFHGGVKLVPPLQRGQVGLDGVDTRPERAAPASSMFDGSCPSPSVAPVQRSASIARRNTRSRKAVMMKSG